MSRRISQAGINLIKEFEGCRLTAYQDPVGIWTIGYGHTAGVSPGMTITQAQAEEFLRSDLASFEGYVNNPSFVPITASLTQGQFDALVSFAYNCGPRNLRELCAGQSASGIAATLPLYNRAGGKVLKGLERRRQAEVALFGGGSRKTDEEIAREVIRGLWGVGEDRKRRLTAAGYNAPEIQRIVNEMMRHS